MGEGVDIALLRGICAAFGLNPGQVAFAVDPSGRSVFGEHVFFDACSIRQATQLPSRKATAVFWSVELAQAISLAGQCNAGASLIDSRLLKMQTDLLARALPQVLEEL